MRRVAQQRATLSIDQWELGLKKREQTLLTERRAAEEAGTSHGPEKTRWGRESPQCLPTVEAWLLPQRRWYGNSSSRCPQSGQESQRDRQRREKGGPSIWNTRSQSSPLRPLTKTADSHSRGKACQRKEAKTSEPLLPAGVSVPLLGTTLRSNPEGRRSSDT